MSNVSDTAQTTCRTGLSSEFSGAAHCCKTRRTFESIITISHSHDPTTKAHRRVYQAGSTKAAARSGTGSSSVEWHTWWTGHGRRNYFETKRPDRQ
jgi:hypothetical protein